eukprot:TRINITY_DN6759_c0_g1_i1.p1 TRINITY_DN6759_c0_g1~~TRINITY_DN6759_c0_g1_i1.p1  ORF type:complete len:503 (-),score=111.87 TRINITY_DN6759_c0_g1_i1:71-1510(-)
MAALAPVRKLTATEAAAAQRQHQQPQAQVFEVPSPQRRAAALQQQQLAQQQAQQQQIAGEAGRDGSAAAAAAAAAGTPRTRTPTLPAHLTVNKQLGKGAYGEVFLCDDQRTGVQVAVKWIRDFARDPIFGKRIYREIRLLAALDHPNLLKLADLLPVPSPTFNDIYIAMPYMHCDLHKVIHSKMQLSSGHAEAFVCQILRGLKYLHSAGVVHRDLKPANVLVNKDCTLRIADYGLARGRSSGEEQLTDYVVTRWYRAPELMLMPSGYFEAVDLWSVGCIHVELLSRKPLFPGENHVDMLKRIARTLGFSRERDLAWLPAHGSARDQVLDFVELLGLPDWQSPDDPLEAKMPEPGASEVCLEFVRDLLAFDPTRRISASGALVHRYIAHLSDPNAETVATEQVPWEFDLFEPKPEALRERIYRECAKLHPEILVRDAPPPQQPPAPAVASAVAEQPRSMPLGPPPARLPRARGTRVVNQV